MNISWRRLVCAAALACALPVSAASPTDSSARIGPMRISVVDADLADGIEAGYTLLGDRGRYFDTSFVDGRWVVDNDEFSPASGTTAALFSESDGETIRAFAQATDSLTYAEGSMAEIWVITLTANTLLTIEMDAEVSGSGWASTHVALGGESFSEVIQSGSDVFRVEYSSGASEVLGSINRRVSATALIDMPVPPSPIPEPSTALLLLTGLGGLALRKRRAV